MSNVKNINFFAGVGELAKISFKIILLNLAVRKIANFLLIDLFVFNL